MIGRLFMILVCTFFTIGVYAQKKKSEKTAPSSIDPGNNEIRYVPKASRKNKKSGLTYEARNDFEDRMEKNWKEREKHEKNISGEKKADKTQPPYFGHKRPPKIRPADKRKVCKVCGIKH